MAEGTKGNQAPAVKARNKAIRRLLEKHQDDYRVMLAEERKSAGLSPDPEADKRQQKIAKLREQLAALEGETPTQEA